MSIELTGLSYDDWERDARSVERVAEAFERTGLADALHVERARRLEAEIADEIGVVDDVRAMSDPETAMGLTRVRLRLADLRRRMHAVRDRLRARNLGRPDGLVLAQDERTTWHTTAHPPGPGS